MADVRPDSGALLAAKTKRHEKAPDYFGEIVVDLSNDTKLERRGHLLVIKLSGWKRVSKSGNTFLSLAVDRFIPRSESTPRNESKAKELDEDIPF